MRRLTPHLVNLLSANQFFDTLNPTGGHTAVFCAAHFLKLSLSETERLNTRCSLVLSLLSTQK